MSTFSLDRCDYCHKPRKSANGWHGCPQSQAARQRMNAAIEGSIGISIGISRKKRLITK